MELLTKFTFVSACLFAEWAVTFIAVANCSISPSEMSGDSGLKLPSAVIPVSQKSTLGSFDSLGLSSTFPEDLEVNEYCTEMLRIYGQRYVTLANCLVTYARPVKICQNCYTGFNSLEDIYKNISSDQVGARSKSKCPFLTTKCLYMFLHGFQVDRIPTRWSHALTSRDCVCSPNPTHTDHGILLNSYF